MAASPQASRNCLTLLLGVPSSSPTLNICMVEKCRITPGFSINALILATPPRTEFSPSVSFNISICPIPFKNGITPVLAPIIGFITFAAD